MDRKALLEKTAIATGVVIVLAAVWFWGLQVQDTLDTLRLAYPD